MVHLHQLTNIQLFINFNIDLEVHSIDLFERILFHKTYNMKSSFFLTSLALLTLFCVSCKKKSFNPVLTEKQVDLGTHKLTSYSSSTGSKYLIVFESGAGNDASVWTEKDIRVPLSAISDLMVYDRAGYGKSQKGPAPRNIDRLSNELAAVIAANAGDRKIILVCHSLGGLIARAYAFKNPAKIAALLFLDSSHELYNHWTQAEEDNLYESTKAAYGSEAGILPEIRELREDLEYMTTLPNLPDVPVRVITSMQTSAAISTADRQLLFNAHESLKAGVTDFQHLSTVKSGHFIMLDEPSLVIDNIKQLLSKLP